MRPWLAASSAIVLGVAIAYGVAHPDAVQRLLGRPSLPAPAAPSPLEPLSPEDEPDLTYDQRLEKGDYFYGRGFFTLAANEYVKATRLESKKEEPYFRLFKANFSLGAYEKAQRNAETLLEFNPGSAEARIALAQALLRQSRWDEAQEALKPLTEGGKSDPQALYFKSLILLTLGQNDEGEAMLKRASAGNLPAELLKNAQTVLEAFREFRFAQGAEPLYLSELIARSFNQVGEYTMAIQRLKDILRERGDLRDSWNLLGFAYLNLNEYPFALAGFERAYELDPELPSTSYFLAQVQAEMGQKERAVTYLQTALKNGFEPAETAQRKLADLYFDLGRNAEAAGLYQKLATASPSDVSAFVRPVWLYLDYLNQPLEAVKIAQEAVKAYPESAMAYNLLGWSQTEAKDYAEAEKSLSQALRLNPNLASVHFNYGRLYEALNKPADAVLWYKQAYQLDQNGSIGQKAAERFNALTQ